MSNCLCDPCQLIQTHTHMIKNMHLLLCLYITQMLWIRFDMQRTQIAKKNALSLVLTVKETSNMDVTKLIRNLYSYILRHVMEISLYIYTHSTAFPWINQIDLSSVVQTHTRTRSTK